MLRVVAATVLCVAVLSGCGSNSPETAATSKQSEQRETTTSTTTTAPVTTTTSVQDAIGAAMDVEVTRAELDGDDALDMHWIVTNTSQRAITAFQLYLNVVVTDPLGRTESMVAQKDCTTRPIGAGERVEVVVPAPWTGEEIIARMDRGDYSMDPYFDIWESAVDNCVAGSWSLNPYIASEAAISRAMLDGAVPTVTPVVSRVVFDDGSSLGEAGG
ncbi:MAG: hypothetical protein WBF71_15385 [Microthrixaceae bacterium]